MRRNETFLVTMCKNELRRADFRPKMEQNGGLLKMGILGSDTSKEVRQVLQVVGSDSSLRNSFLRRSSNYPITISVQQVM